LSRQQNVIAVQVLDEVSPGYLPACFSRRTRPGISLMDHPKLSRILASQLVGDLPCVVGRAIVDDDDLDRAISLSKNTGHRFAKHRGAVVDRNDGGDQAGHDY